MNEGRAIGYSSKQVRAFCLLLMGAVVVAAIHLWRNGSYVSDPQPSQPIHAADLADRIDPNVADLASLSALPQVGTKRAREIVAYRERVHGTDATRLAFHRPEDLLRLSGFGLTIMEQLRPYLIFSEAPPATTQSAG